MTTDSIICIHPKLWLVITADKDNRRYNMNYYALLIYESGRANGTFNILGFKYVDHKPIAQLLTVITQEHDVPTGVNILGESLESIASIDSGAELLKFRIMDDKSQYIEEKFKIDDEHITLFRYMVTTIAKGDARGYYSKIQILK